MKCCFIWVGVLGVFSSSGCDQEEEQRAPRTVVDSCVVAPGPNYCELAFNGLCEEPLGCFLGTGYDDYRGEFTLEDEPELSCANAREVGIADKLQSEVFSFVWDGMANDHSFALVPIVMTSMLPYHLESDPEPVVY